MHISNPLHLLASGLTAAGLLTAAGIAACAPAPAPAPAEPITSVVVSTRPAAPVPTPGTDPRNPDPLLNYCAAVWLGTEPYPGGNNDQAYDACVAPLGR